MRKTLFPLLSLLAAGLVLAQEGAEKPATPEEMILQLGSESYEVRESATRALVEMGEKALPALEKALQSEDVEVRMRAGRALRAIRDGKERKEAPPEVEREGEARPGIQHRGYSIQIQDGRVKVQVKEVVDGEERTREYEGESLEQLKRDHPELEGVLGGFRLHLGNGLRGPDRERDPFWGGNLRGLDEDFWKDLQREQQRTEELLARMQEQRRRILEEFRQRFDARAQGAALGVRVTKPEPVLDAQLELRGRGLVLESVDPDSVADRLGLQRFDILLALNGVEIGAAQDVAAAMRGLGKEGKATATIIRRGKMQELTTGE